MKKTYIAPQITVMDLEMKSQILAGSQVPVEVEITPGEYEREFYSSENILVWDVNEEQ